MENTLHNTLLGRCCPRCTHTQKTPCERYVSCRQSGPLCHDDPTCREWFAARRAWAFDRDGQAAVVYVGLGTCGLAAGARKVYDALAKYATERAASAQPAARPVRLKNVGCRGLCAREPMVDIALPGRPRVIFGDVTVERVPALIHYLETGELAAGAPALAWFAEDGFDDGGRGGVRNAGLDGGLNCGLDGGLDGRLGGCASLPELRELPVMRKQKRVVLANCGVIAPDSLAEYVARGGYSALEKALHALSPDEVVKEVELSGLRGRGGGGFPTGTKWRFVRQAVGERKYVVCNADEGDPGAFMDRSVLEGDPHRVLEGMIIAAYAIGADYGYIYARAEYPLAIKRLRAAIADLRDVGLLGENILGSDFAFDISIKVGAGAFVCGEETALLASIEGNRGMPRPRPPFPAQSGLWGCPTNINNVETYANVPALITNGGAWFASIGAEKSKGTKVFALTGKVANTGLVEVPMGTTLRELIFEVGGGIANGAAFKAAQIGGPSGGCLPESALDTPIDYDSLLRAGAMMGSGGLVVMDEDTCMVDVARFFINFTRDESCGKCVPCREGTKRLSEILEQIVGVGGGSAATGANGAGVDPLNRFKNVTLLQTLAASVKDTAACGLGQTAPNPILSTLRYFRDEYEAHVFEKRCPAKQCKALLHYEIDPAICKGCGVCARKCPAGAIVGEKKKAHYVVEEKCQRCGACAEACRFEAVAVS